MENTNNYRVQPEGVWIIDGEKNIAFRIKGGLKVEIPNPMNSPEILEEIKKQNEAESYFKLFPEVSMHNEMIIGYLNFMLDDYYNHLCVEHQKEFLKYIQSISHLFEDKNSFYLQRICTCLKKNNLDEFFDTKEAFQLYNQSYFSEMSNTKEECHHLY